MKKIDLARLERNERTMLRWMCSIKPTEDINAQDRSAIASLEPTIRYRRLHRYGHMQRSSSWIKKNTVLEVVGQKHREGQGEHGQRFLQMTSGLPSCQVKMPRIGVNARKELQRSMQCLTHPEVKTDNRIVGNEDQTIIHSSLSKIKNKILPICFGHYRDSLGEFSNTSCSILLC